MGEVGERSVTDERSDYVVMHKPPLGQHEAPGNLAGRIEQATRPDREE